MEIKRLDRRQLIFCRPLLNWSVQLAVSRLRPSKKPEPYGSGFCFWRGTVRGTTNSTGESGRRANGNPKGAGWRSGFPGGGMSAWRRVRLSPHSVRLNRLDDLASARAFEGLDVGTCNRAGWRALRCIHSKSGQSLCNPTGAYHEIGRASCRERV